MYVKRFDTVMLYYVILVNGTFCHFQISRLSVPVHPDVAGNGTQKTDAGICQRTLPGDTAGGTSQERRVERRTDPGEEPHGKPECSSGLPLVIHSEIPPGRL
ncbi:unnamed protein product, partial [Staurois parvus]